MSIFKVLKKIVSYSFFCKNKKIWLGFISIFISAGILLFLNTTHAQKRLIRSLNMDSQYQAAFLSNELTGLLRYLDLVEHYFQDIAKTVDFQNDSDIEKYKMFVISTYKLIGNVGFDHIIMMDEKNNLIFTIMPPNLVKITHDNPQNTICKCQTITDKNGFVIKMMIFLNPPMIIDRYNNIWNHSIDNIFLFNSEGLIIANHSMNFLEKKTVTNSFFSSWYSIYTSQEMINSEINYFTYKGIKNLYKVKQLGDYPYYLLITKCMPKHLSSWRKSLKKNIIIYLCFFTISILCMLFYFYRKMIMESINLEVLDALEKRVASRTKEIEDQKRTLAIKERQYHTLFSKMKEGFTLHEVISNEKGEPVDYRLIDVNPAFEELTGLMKNAIIGKTAKELPPLFSIINPYCSKWKKAYNENIATGVPVTFEGYSEYIDLFCRIVFFSPQAGQFALFYTDITERKKTEILLEKERKWLIVTWQSIGDGIISTDIRGVIKGLNRTAEILTGWSSKEAQGRSITEVFKIINKETREPCDNPIEKVIQTKIKVELADNTYLIARDNQEKDISDSSVSPIIDDNGDPIGCVIVFQDITEKQKLAKLMFQTQKLDSLGILAGGIAHDFNNQLFGIFGFLELALEYLHEREYHKILYCLESALEVQQHTQGLTSQLLTFAKGGAPIRKKVDLIALIPSCVSFALSGAQTVASLQIDENLWACYCDESQIRQVIDNLVINAKQAMFDRGKIHVRAKNCEIEKKTDSKESKNCYYICLTIEDEGKGIPANIMDHIFDPFYTTKDNGHGLGLATVHSIINKHKGWIEVDYGKKGGALFNVYLPALRDRVFKNEKKTDALIPQKGLILVMDDELYILQILEKMLSALGFHPVTADNSQKAIDFFTEAESTENPFIACILDLTQPGGEGGKETARKIREVNSSVILIATSGYSQDPIMQSPSQYGFSGQLTKPFHREEMEQLLSRLLTVPSYS